MPRIKNQIELQKPSALNLTIERGTREKLANQASEAELSMNDYMNIILVDVANGNNKAVRKVVAKKELQAVENKIAEYESKKHKLLREIK